LCLNKTNEQKLKKEIGALNTQVKQENKNIGSNISNLHTVNKVKSFKSNFTYKYA
jgi:hypothetical protein